MVQERMREADQQLIPLSGMQQPTLAFYSVLVGAEEAVSMQAVLLTAKMPQELPRTTAGQSMQRCLSELFDKP